MVVTARAAFLSRFAWDGGHADIWRVFAHGPTLKALAVGLAAPWRESGITRVVGVESRGFLLGGAVAIELGVGFLAVRKPGGILPGRKLITSTAPDYRGFSHQLRIQDVLTADDVVLLVDDWAERGSQAAGVRTLVRDAGAFFAGVSVLVDQLEDDRRAALVRVTSLVRASELGDPDP